jgi:hypothetical protein
MFNPIRLIAALLGILVLATPIAAVVFFFLAITGSPGTCNTEERTITTSFQFAAAYEEKWDGLEAALDTGQAASATFSESEVTSRASVWLQEQDAPIEEIMICFGDGTAAASAKIDIPFVPGDINVLARGSLILTGTVADSELTDLEVGGLPGPLTDLVENFINNVIEDQTEDLDLDHSFMLTFTEGAVTISGVP